MCLGGSNGVTCSRIDCSTQGHTNHSLLFFGHFSRLSFVNLQRTTSATDTIQAKEAFESFARSHGVTVAHYHADNGRFAESKFLSEVANHGQTISFSGAYAHFQNGIAEKQIRDLQDQARTMLIHAKARWPTAITTALWPYAIQSANECHSLTPRPHQTKSPLELFASVNVAPKLKDLHVFGCPG